jgi:galactose-1-phosphate uridylyltransferase
LIVLSSVNNVASSTFDRLLYLTSKFPDYFFLGRPDMRPPLYPATAHLGMAVFE